MNRKTNSKNIAVVFCIIMFINVFCGKETTGPENHNPLISSIETSKLTANFNEQIDITAVTTDVDDDSLRYLWTSNSGALSSNTDLSITWTAPPSAIQAAIYLRVTDGNGGSAYDSVVISVDNQLPQVTEITASMTNVPLGNIITLNCNASDADNDDLIYTWEATDGEFFETENNNTKWRAPLVSKIVTVTVKVEDTNGGSDEKSIEINTYQEFSSIWVSDTYKDEVVKVSPSGSELYRIPGFTRPAGLAVNKIDRSVFVADWGGNRIVRLSSEGQVLSEIPDIKNPKAVSVYQLDGTAWVVFNGDSIQAVKISNDGSTILKSIYGLKNPQGIDIDQGTGDVWIADTENNRIVKIKYECPDTLRLNDPVPLNPDSIFHEVISVVKDLANSSFKRPVSISVDASTGDTWVADRENDRAIRLTNDSQKSQVIVTGLKNPEMVAVNRRDRSCWVADTGNNRVVRLLPQISEVSGIDISITLGFHIEFTGFIQPFAIAINHNDNTAWFAEDKSIVRVNDSGILLLQVLGFDSPRGVTLYPGQW